MDNQIYLSKIIDNEKNTYMHKLAEKLDVNFISICNKNLSDAKIAVNMQNIYLDTPLHVALESLLKNNQTQELIDYMINQLEADVSIVGHNNRIVVYGLNNSISKLDNELCDVYQQMSFLSEINHKKNVNKFSGNDIDTNMNSQGLRANDISNFVDELLKLYSSAQTGGVSGRRRIQSNQSRVSESDMSEISSINLSSANSEYGHNEFLLPKDAKQNLLSDFKKYMAITSMSGLSEMSRMRAQRDPKLMDVYKTILAKLATHLKLDEADSKLYGTILKIVVGQRNPELKKPENDELRLKEIEKIVESKEKIDDALTGIDIDALKNSIKERMAERQKSKEEYLKTKAAKMSDSEKSTPMEEEKPKKTKKAINVEKPAKKTATKKSKVSENGYLMSDELVFSPGF